MLKVNLSVMCWRFDICILKIFYNKLIVYMLWNLLFDDVFLLILSRKYLLILNIFWSCILMISNNIY